MNVTLAKSAGFCFGVKRAVNMVYEEIEKGNGPIYTYGPIIHNDEVVKDFEKHGVVVVKDLAQLDELEKGKIIVRSHGISRAEYITMEEKGYEVIDATCPFVRKIHKLVDEHSKQGEYIVIIGNPNHQEVCGIKGWVNGDAVSIIESKEEAEEFTVNLDKKVCIVSQTTFNNNKFQYIVEIFKKKGYNVSVVNTICNATQERQSEAKELAAEADVMIVIGGKHSSNTRKLYEICSKECDHTYFIQTLDDLHLELPKSVRLVGITAGASTPNNIIEEVQNYVRINF